MHGSKFIVIPGLPAAELKRDDGSGETFYSIGFSLGQVQEPVPVLHNHYNIFLEWVKPVFFFFFLLTSEGRRPA